MEPQQEPLAIRRIKKLRTRYPEASPAEIAERVEQAFVRDFMLLGGTEAGVTQMLPGAVHAAHRNSRVARLTSAAGQLGVVQSVANYTQKTAQGIGTAAKVGFSQSIKTYVYAAALLHGLEVTDSEDAATRVLGGGIHQLLRTLDQPIAYENNQPGVTPLNVLAAVAQIGARNPQMFLLVKSGEQLVRSGGSVMASSKAHREFAQQLIVQVREVLGDLPADFPARFALAPAPAPAPDLAATASEELAASPASEVASTPAEEVRATPAQQVQATSAEELERLAQENTAAAKGAKMAAKAFMFFRK